MAPPKVDLDTQALFEAAKSNPIRCTFRSGDEVLAKRADMPKDQDHAAQIILDLATIFDEADVDKDGKLTLEEWHNRCGTWLEKEQLQKLFTECDTNGDGTLDHSVLDLLADLFGFFFAQRRLALAVFAVLVASTRTLFFFDVLVKQVA